MKLLKLIPTILVKYLLGTFYRFFCVFSKVDTNKVTFASYRSNVIKDNLAYVDEEISREFPSLKRHFLFKKFNGSSLGKMKYIFHMIKACYHLATSRYFIIDDYYFPIYVIKPRKNVEIIQLWHSAGALKKFGYSTVGKSFGPSRSYLNHVNIHGNYSKAYVSSSEVIPYFAEAFNMSEDKIYPLGVPRTDYFYNKDAVKRLRVNFYNDYPELVGKKLLLYAPTFRGKSHYQDSFEVPFDLEYMAEQLHGEYSLLIHLHPYMRSGLKLNNQTFAYEIRNAYGIQELLALTDILITDYSTVFIDYSLLERPMIFYPYDLEAYKRERDFYYKYEDLIPGPMVTDTESLVRTIKEKFFNMEGVSQFRNLFFRYQDGKSTERIVEHIFKDKSDTTFSQ